MDKLIYMAYQALRGLALFTLNHSLILFIHQVFTESTLYQALF